MEVLAELHLVLELVLLAEVGHGDAVAEELHQVAPRRRQQEVVPGQSSSILTFDTVKITRYSEKVPSTSTFSLLKVKSVFITVSMSKLRMAVPVQHGARVVADEVPVATELAAVGDLAQLRLHLAHDPLHGITVLPVPALTHGYSEDDLTDPAPPHLVAEPGRGVVQRLGGQQHPGRAPRAPHPADVGPALARVTAPRAQAVEKPFVADPPAASG